MKSITVILILIFIASCAPTYEITKKDMGGSLNAFHYKSPKIKIKGDSQNDYDMAYLEYNCDKSDSGTVYLFSLEYIGPQWIGVKELALDVDGLKSTHQYDRPPVANSKDIRGLNEIIFVPIPKNKIIDIIEIRDCKLKIVGEYKSIEINMKQDWINKLEIFYEETLK